MRISDWSSDVCSSDLHIGRTRPDRARADHRPAAAHLLGISDRGVRHRLLVMRAPGRQPVARGMERLAQPGDVAVAEDRPGPCEKGCLPLAVIDRLRRQDRKSTRPNSSHQCETRMPSSACKKTKLTSKHTTT